MNTPLVEIPYARIVDDMLVGGRPTQQNVDSLKAAGYQCVIDLSGDSEPGVAAQRQRHTEIGLTYVSIPVRGAIGVTKHNARRLADALESAPRPVVVHCQTGNRVGALLALKAYHIDGVNAEQAIAFGIRCGLTRLENHVRTLLLESP